MTIRKWLCEKLCEQTDTPLPYRPFDTLYPVSGYSIYKTLHAQYPDAHIRIADEEYNTVSLNEFNRWIREDCVSEMIYQKNWRDCDDYAHEIKCRILRIGREYKTTIAVAYCEGHISCGYHAFNLLIDNEDKIWVLEPQTDALTSCSKNTYLPDFIQL